MCERDKEIKILIKENQKLQADLKMKNDMMTSILDQNFSQLKDLNDKNEKIISSVVSNYLSNVELLEENYKQLRSDLRNRVKKYVDTHTKLMNDRISKLLVKNQLSDDTKMVELSNKYCILETKCLELENQNKQLIVVSDNNYNIRLQYENMVSDLNRQKMVLDTELNLARQEIIKNNNMILFLTAEMNSVKTSFQEIQEIEMESAKIKIDELGKKIILYEHNQSELNVKLVDCINQIDNLELELLTAQGIIQQNELEINIVMEEKKYYVSEYDNLKSKMHELETNVLLRISEIQDQCKRDKDICAVTYEKKMLELSANYDEQIFSLKAKYITEINDKEVKITGLTNNLKVFVENQYFTSCEVEKNKLLYDKLKGEYAGIDKKIDELNEKHKNVYTELELSHKKEKDVLVNSYNETIRKTQDLNDILQQRLSQSVEALGMSKIAITNLKENNLKLEKQLGEANTSVTDDDIKIKYDSVTKENSLLREKLEKSIELNNNFSNKEKQYEYQIKQLQTKCNQIISFHQNKGIS